MRQLRRLLEALHRWADGGEVGAIEPGLVRPPGLDRRRPPTAAEVLAQVSGVVMTTHPDLPVVDLPEPLGERTRAAIAAEIALEKHDHDRLPKHFTDKRSVHMELIYLLIDEFNAAPVEATP